jgi:hypothetical protein
MRLVVVVALLASGCIHDKTTRSGQSANAITQMAIGGGFVATGSLSGLGALGTVVASGVVPSDELRGGILIGAAGLAAWSGLQLGLGAYLLISGGNRFVDTMENASPRMAAPITPSPTNARPQELFERCLPSICTDDTDECLSRAQEDFSRAKSKKQWLIDHKCELHL